MTQLSPSNVAFVAKQAGFSGNGLVMAVAIAMAENGPLDPAATSHNTDGNRNIGIWQIDTINAPGADLTNPYVNAQAAFKVSKGGTNWGPWETYHNGAYKANLDIAQAAAKSPSAATDNTPLWEQWLQGAKAGLNAVPGGGGIANIPDAVPNPLAGIDKVAAVIEAAYKAITDGKMWRSFGWLMLGAGLLVAGFLILSRLPQKAAQVATSVGGAAVKAAI